MVSVDHAPSPPALTARTAVEVAGALSKAVFGCTYVVTLTGSSSLMSCQLASDTAPALDLVFD